MFCFSTENTSVQPQSPRGTGRHMLQFMNSDKEKSKPAKSYTLA